MPLYEIECETSGREVYQIEAQSEDKARYILYNKAPKPVVSEVLSFETVLIKEVIEK